VVSLLKLLHDSFSHVPNTKRVLKPGVYGSGKNIVDRPQLFDLSQSLDLRRVNNLPEGGAEGYLVVNTVLDIALPLRSLMSFLFLARLVRQKK
jgi:hypothetical protein